jgi:large subunit ribosomal protein L24
MSYKMKLKSGDTVIIRAGKFKGRTGKIIAVHPKDNKVTVEGINVVKRNYKPTQARPQGGQVELTKPLWTSKVALYDAAKKKASRVAMKVNKDGSKARVLKTSGKEVK